MSSSSILKSHGGVLGQASKQAVKAFSRSHALEGLVLFIVGKLRNMNWIE